jgi:hypothetical protein
MWMRQPWAPVRSRDGFFVGDDVRRLIVKAPNTKLQVPEKVQISSSKFPLIVFEIWS